MLFKKSMLYALFFIVCAAFMQQETNATQPSEKTGKPLEQTTQQSQATKKERAKGFLDCCDGVAICGRSWDNKTYPVPIGCCGTIIKPCAPCDTGNSERLLRVCIPRMDDCKKPTFNADGTAYCENGGQVSITLRSCPNGWDVGNCPSVSSIQKNNGVKKEGKE